VEDAKRQDVTLGFANSFREVGNGHDEADHLVFGIDHRFDEAWVQQRHIALGQRFHLGWGERTVAVEVQETGVHEVEDAVHIAFEVGFVFKLDEGEFLVAAHPLIDPAVEVCHSPGDIEFIDHIVYLFGISAGVEVMQQIGQVLVSGQIGDLVKTVDDKGFGILFGKAHGAHDLAHALLPGPVFHKVQQRFGDFWIVR